MPESIQRLHQNQEHPREELPRHAGHRVHHPEREALDAPDEDRQENGLCGIQDRRRYGKREGLITKEEALMRVEPDQLNQLLRPIFDPGRKESAGRGQAGGQRIERRSRRGVGQGCFQRRRCRRVGSTRRAGDPREDRDVTGRYPGHERGTGHSHRPRRHDKPRGTRCPSDGQGAVLPAAANWTSITEEDHRGQRQDHQRGRFRLHRRDHR